MLRFGLQSHGPLEGDATTMRLLIWYDTAQSESWPGSSLAFAIFSRTASLATSQKAQSICIVRRLSYISVNDKTLDDISEFGSGLNGDEKKLLAVTLDYITTQRYAALRDGLLMARSRRQEDITRMKALSRLENQLAAYRSMLITNAQMSRFEGPTTRGLAALRHWFRGGASKTLDPNDLPLQGLAKGVYVQRKHAEDLVAVRAPSGRDYLSRLTKILLPKLFKVRGEQPMQDLKGAYFYSDTKIATLVSVVGAFLGVGLLIGAIVGLDQLDTKGARLGLICALTAAFAMVLLFTTTTTRGEVFGATAAYAAVLVVYVGGTLGNSPAAAA